MLIASPAMSLLVALLLEQFLPIPARFKPFHQTQWLTLLEDKVSKAEYPVSQQRLAGLLLPLLIFSLWGIFLLALNNLLVFRPLFDCLVLIWVMESQWIKNNNRILASLLEKRQLASARLQLGGQCLRQRATLQWEELLTTGIESSCLRLFNHWFAVAFWYLCTGIYGALFWCLLVSMSESWNQKLPKNRHFGALVATLYRCGQWPPLLLLLAALTLHQGGARGLHFAIKQYHNWPTSCAGLLLTSLAGSFHIRLGGPRIYGSMLYRWSYVGDNQAPHLQHLLLLPRRLQHAAWLCYLFLFVIYGFYLWSQYG